MSSIKGRRRTGSLYRRLNKKNYPVDDPLAKKGKIYLKYKINGKSCFKSLGTTNIDEAKKKQAQIMRPLEMANEEEALDIVRMKLEQNRKAQKKEMDNNRKPLLLSEAWTAYLLSENRPQSGTRTLKGYSSIVTQFIQWIAEVYPSISRMNEISTEQSEAYAKHLTARNLSPSSFNQHVGALALVWSVLFDKALAEINPFIWDKKNRKGIQRRSIKAETYKRRKKALSIEDVNKVLEIAKGEYRTLILILACTGQRLVDAVKLEWKQVNFTNRVVSLVPRKTERRTGKPVFIPLLPPLQAALEKCARKNSYVLPELVDLYDRDDSELSKKIQRLFNDAGINTSNGSSDQRKITTVGAHSLRHTFVTIARNAKIPDAMIFQITGHSTKEMLEHYTQFTPEMAATLSSSILGSPMSALAALPNPSSNSDKAPLPEWAKQEISHINELIESIIGKENMEIKATLLTRLNDLVR